MNNPKQKSKQDAPVKGQSPKSKAQRGDFAMGKMNYILIFIGVIIIAIGFILMSGTENIFGFVKTNLSVSVVMIGFFFIIYAIMKRPKDKAAE